ncbi:hypothetical protein GUJ93_ZPchr0006g46083 [Zizania palustris]|uniref:Uncharacterized protein n=1 Tax=Zizania palustris TaxID=103762 RepID=A0A8J5ST28_ZIZPA|nr:hypothetical protein GUJ93_ZPchr0006g46083 [Zizania palustris]
MTIYLLRHAPTTTIQCFLGYGQLGIGIANAGGHAVLPPATATATQRCDEVATLPTKKENPVVVAGSRRQRGNGGFLLES